MFNWNLIVNLFQICSNKIINQLKLEIMLYVKITKEEALKIGSKQTGITSGRRDKVTGERETIYFCSNLVFISNFDREKEFVTI